MENYKFTFNEQSYELNKDNCIYFLNDEDDQVRGLEVRDILKLLNQGEEVNFDIKYYGQPCQNCQAGKEEKAKHFQFLEYHFYILTKQGEYVISTISEEYKNKSYSKLLKEGSIDNSYIVSILVCFNCGEYAIEIEQCDI